MSDTARLKPYTPQSLPKMPGSLERFIVEELQRLASSNAEVIAAMQRLEARMVLGGI